MKETRYYVSIVYRKYVVANKVGVTVEEPGFFEWVKKAGKKVRRVVWDNLDEHVGSIWPSGIFEAREKEFSWGVFSRLDSLEPIYCSKHFPIEWYAAEEADRLSRGLYAPHRSREEYCTPGRKSGKSLLSTELTISEWGCED